MFLGYKNIYEVSKEILYAYLISQTELFRELMLIIVV